jgi:prepilin-type processing-associated H-X9-DG protein
MGMYQGPSLGYGGYLGTWYAGVTCFPAMLPQMEQQALAAAYNYSIASYDLGNRTILATGLNTLWCPSDGTISTGQPAPSATSDFGAYISSTQTCYRSSYSSCAGIWMTSAFPTPGNTAAAPFNTNALVTAAQQDCTGLFGYQYSNSIAKVTDGTSNTIAFGEVANGLIPIANGRYGFGIWAFAGYNAGDSGWFATMYGVNPQRRLAVTTANYISWYSPETPLMMAMSASSFHPGGCNFAMADGSVRFMKDTTATMATTSNPPVGMYYNGYNTYALSTNQLPPFQALSTIAGGEVVSGDAY